MGKDAPTWSKPQLIKNVLPERPKLNLRQMPNSTVIILVPTLPHMLDLDTPTLTLPTLDILTLVLPTPGIPMLKRLLKDIPTFLAPTLPTKTNTTKCTIVKSSGERPLIKKQPMLVLPYTTSKTNLSKKNFKYNYQIKVLNSNVHSFQINI